MTDIAAATAERLRTFSGDLNPQIIDSVAEAMARNIGDRALDAMEVTGKLQAITHEGPAPMRVLDIIPSSSYDERSAVVMGLMWGQGLTPWVARQVMLLHECMPTDRIVAFATPAGSSARWGSFTPAQRAAVKNGDFSPLVAPLLYYLRRTGVERVQFVGTSFGGDEVAAATAQAADYDMAVDRVVTIEPASIVQRGIGRLVLDFCATRRSIAPHVGVSGDAPYDKLHRAEFTLTSTAGLAVNSLLRPMSRAAVAYLAGGQFGRQMLNALASQRHMVAQIVWGTSSELAPYAHAQSLAEALQAQHGGRVSVLWLPELGHGLCSDHALTTVLALQGLGRVVGTR